MEELREEEEKKTEPLDWCVSSGELFGREEQTKALKDVYKRRRKLNAQSEFALITGVSGSGKSALARTIRQRVDQG